MIHFDICYRVYTVIIIPREKGILFSVCLSVRLSGTLFFSFCARNSSYSFHHTQTKPIPSESWMSGVCHGGSPFFRTPQNFGEIGLWKWPKITNSNFWSVTSQSSGSRNATPIPYESLASVVLHDLLSLSVRPIFSSEMTSENVSGDACQEKFWQKRPSQIPDFFFFFGRTCARGHGGSCALRPLVCIV